MIMMAMVMVMMMMMIAMCPDPRLRRRNLGIQRFCSRLRASSCSFQPVIVKVIIMKVHDILRIIIIMNNNNSRSNTNKKNNDKTNNNKNNNSNSNSKNKQNSPPFGRARFLWSPLSQSPASAFSSKTLRRNPG